MSNENGVETNKKVWYKDAYALSGIATAIFSPLMGLIVSIIGYCCGEEHSGKVMLTAVLSFIVSFILVILLF